MCMKPKGRLMSLVNEPFGKDKNLFFTYTSKKICNFVFLLLNHLFL